MTGGGFTHVNGLFEPLIVRLNGDGRAAFTGLALLPGGSTRLKVAAQPHRTYVLEASTDLRTWTALDTNAAAGLTLEFEDADARNAGERFYRIWRQ